MTFNFHFLSFSQLSYTWCFSASTTYFCHSRASISMDSTNDIQRGSCSNKTGLKQCSRCKKMPYCSIECQKADWRGHKKICRYTASSSVQVRQPDNVLSELRQMNDHPLCSPGEAEETMTATLKVFNTAEIRMAVFSYLPAAVLLHSQRVCRSWYRTIALEKILQQRLFMEYGPGKLIQAAYKGWPKAFLFMIQNANRKRRRGGFAWHSTTYRQTGRS